MDLTAPKAFCNRNQQVHSEAEIQRILPIAREMEVPITFRAAGTSLSGQAVTDSVLLKLSHTGKNFRNYTIHVRICSASAASVRRVCCCMVCPCPAVTKARDPRVLFVRSSYDYEHSYSTEQISLYCLQGDGSQITVEPGLIGGEVNRLLEAYKVRHPTSPSEGFCMPCKQP